MSELYHIVDTVLDLVKKEQHEIAFKILDFYYTKAKTLEDFDVIGMLALKTNHTGLIVKCAEDSYALAKTNEELFVARVNLAKAYYAMNYPEKALAYTELNLEINPYDFDQIVQYAAALKLNGQVKESEELIDKLHNSDFITPEQREGLRITYTDRNMRVGNVGLGIEYYLYKEEADYNKVTTFSLLNIPRWNRVPIKGKKIYVYAGGGIGDEFINIRFFEHLRREGMIPILFSILERDDLAAVFRRNGFEVITNPLEIDHDSVWTFLMDLPIDLNVREKDLWYGPYIKPIGKNKLKSKRPKIGIKCNGNKYFGQDVYRSIPMDEMLECLQGLNADIYYFDIDKEDYRVNSLKDQINSWDDTLDYLSQMDIVLSSCTSLVHAAGAMGVTTIVLPPILQYYVWNSTRTDNSTPWYGENFYVCKQTKVRSWAEPLAEARKIIEGLI